MGRIAPENFSAPLKFFPWGITHKRRAEYLIIAKLRLVLASVPYARSIYRGRHMPPTWFKSSGAYAPYAPRLDTPLLCHWGYSNFHISTCPLPFVIIWLNMYVQEIREYCETNICITFLQWYRLCTFFVLFRTNLH